MPFSRYGRVRLGFSIMVFMFMGIGSGLRGSLRTVFGFGFGPYATLGINIGLHATAGTATEIHGDMVRGFGHHVEYGSILAFVLPSGLD